jgi:hypothetical protein
VTITIVSATILAQLLIGMQRESTPSVFLEVRLENSNLILKHAGGSPLSAKDLEIFLNETRINITQSAILCLGDNLTIPVSAQTGKVYRVSVVYVPTRKLLYTADVLSC